MTQLIDEVNEIKQMMANRLAGTMSPEDYNAQMAGYNQVERRYRDLLTACALAIKMKSPLTKGVFGELIGSGKFKTIKRLENRTPNRGK